MNLYWIPGVRLWIDLAFWETNSGLKFLQAWSFVTTYKWSKSIKVDISHSSQRSAFLSLGYSIYIPYVLAFCMKCLHIWLGAGIPIPDYVPHVLGILAIYPEFSPWFLTIPALPGLLAKFARRQDEDLFCKLDLTTVRSCLNFLWGRVSARVAVNHIAET